MLAYWPPFLPYVYLYFPNFEEEMHFFPLKTFSSWQNNFVFRDEKNAICWKYEERFLIKVDQLWKIALTDTLEVLSLEE